MKKLLPGFYIMMVMLLSLSSYNAQDHTIAREWNEEILHAIRNDFARPTVHARNLWHSSILMYDIWASFDPVAEPYFLGKTVHGFECSFDGFNYSGDPQEAIEEAISFAIYRLMTNRFINSPGGGVIFNSITTKMQLMGYNIGNTATDYQSGDPAALGNYIAEKMIEFGLQDNSFQAQDYANQYYAPVNSPLVVEFPGAGVMNDPNRWQALTLDVFIDQSGNEIPFNTPAFLSPEWGRVHAFALSDDDLTIKNRDGNDYWVYHDPGPPPQISLTEETEGSDQFKWGFSMVPVWASHLDPTDGVLIDISPASFGNSPDLPTEFANYDQYYDYLEGGDSGIGHDLNPHTGQPYEPNIIPRGDYARVLAEFWADGPDSETPPGHWFTILNYVHDHPDFTRQYRGQGEIIDPLEWDVKAYFMLGSAMHDCAVTAWGIKGFYDYLRPISAVRSMCDRGQCTDPNLPNYHIGGMPLMDGLIELVEVGDPLAGMNDEHVGKIKLYTWRGPEYIDNPDIDDAGVGWILGENWWPYQRPSFVTPPFAGYISGHSTFSRAAAELLTALTGDPFFPGGVGEFIAEKNEFLVFEEGPSQDIVLQWATYRDASDQTSLSRIWGGIHPPADDIPGRLIGIEISEDVINLAETYFFKDEDNDGYYNYIDCDDNNEDINPGAPEICDGIDNNCSGAIDEDLTLFAYYLDADNDGFGDAESRIDTCMMTAPAGYVTNSDDCNDANAQSNPALQEVCDGIDNDCNGMIDDGLPLFRYYLDLDNDGFGDITAPLDTCLNSVPAGFASNEFDCNDSNSSINPDIMEICDGIDNDCTGISDDNLPLNRYYLDNDSDGYGDETIVLDTCLASAPIGYVDIAGDCNDQVNDINPLVNEICDGIDNDCNGLIDDGLTLLRYYEDQDTDGFGNPDVFLDTCQVFPPTGYVEDNTDCDDTSIFINPSIEEIADNGIDEDCSGVDLYLESKMFPNPFSQTLTIHLDSDAQHNFYILDVTGQLVHQSKGVFTNNTYSMDLNDLAPGMYFLQITTISDEEIYSSAIVKI